MSGAPRIAFVTEAGPEVGWGHLSRCLALARAAAGAGARAVFAVEGGAEVLARIRAAGADAVPVSWRIAPERAVEAVRAADADAAVVDSYHAAPELLASLRAAAGRLAVVDDMADRPLAADLVMNGGLGAERLPYPRAGSTRYLLGPRYAPLAPEFSAGPAPRDTDRVRRVLVTLGGGRVDAALHAAVEAVDRALARAVIDVAVGASSAVEPRGTTGLNAIEVHRGRPGLRDLMIEADLAVTGGGVTLLELAATGTPAVVVEMADNQRPNVDASLRGGIAVSAGAAGDPGLGQRVERAVRLLAADAGRRRAMGERGRALVDGGGARRAVEALVEAAVAGR